MDDTEKTGPTGRGENAGRFLFFALLATAGMAAIAIAVLAGPLAKYYADQALIRAQQNRVENLGELISQREELLGNINNPSVVARAAISNLNYVPAEAAEAPPVKLPATWPGLESAVASIEQDKAIQKQTSSWQQWVKHLAEQPVSQNILLVLGAGLVLIGLAFFYPLRSGW